jgi:hypothetical protein
MLNRRLVGPRAGQELVGRYLMHLDVQIDAYVEANVVNE